MIILIHWWGENHLHLLMKEGKINFHQILSTNSLYIYLFCNVGMLMQFTLNAISQGRSFRHDSKLLHLTPSHLFPHRPFWGIHWIAGSKPKSLARSWRFLKALASGSWLRYLIDLWAPSLPGCQSPPRLSRLFIRSRTKPSLGGEEFQFLYRYPYILYIDLCSFKSFQNLQYLISYLPFDTTCFTRFRCQDFNSRKLLRKVAWIDPTPVLFSICKHIHTSVTLYAYAYTHSRDTFKILIKNTSRDFNS